MSIANRVIVGFLGPVRCVGLGQMVYEKSNRLTLGESIGRSANQDDGQREALHSPRLSLDNLGCRSHTGGKE